MRGLLIFLTLLVGIVNSACATKTISYYMTDPSGTVIATTDASGQVTARFDYKPYGAPVMDPASGVSYAGHVRDDEVDLVYMQARFYDPATGRFLSVDPVRVGVGLHGGMDRYSYALNNPIANIDPDGRSAIDRDDLIRRFDSDNSRLFDRKFVLDDGGSDAVKAQMLDGVTVTANADSSSGGSGAVIGGAIGFILSLPADAVIDFFSGGALAVTNPAVTGAMTATGAAAGAMIQSQSSRLVQYMRGKKQSGMSDPGAKQWKELTDGEIKALQRHGIDPHDLKPNAKFDLFKDPDGNIHVMQKRGYGEPEPTDYNINDYL